MATKLLSHWEMVDAGLMKEIKTPEDIWHNAKTYFKWCDETPITQKKPVMVGKEAGKSVTVETIRPYSIKALCLHCGIDEEYIKDIRASKAKDSLWYIVISKILYIIYVQNYELAQVDVFNAGFTAKVLSLDKEDTPNQAIQVTVVQGLPSISNSENEILEKLELEKRSGEIAIDKKF